MDLPNAREVSEATGDGIRYSICTLVSNRAEYAAMQADFIAGGFGLSDCEYLYVDNSDGNRLDAFAAYNIFLAQARGEHIVLCHQDVALLHDDRATLDRLLAGLTAHDPDWGVCGNAGATDAGQYVIRITDPHGADTQRGGPFPARVVSLDENFIVVRRDANLALSHDMAGFHYYGADLCVIADVLGFHSYVIDFHLHHRSGGTHSADFHASQIAFYEKYRRAFRPRQLHMVTMTSFAMAPGCVTAAILAARKRLAPLRRWARKRRNAA